MALLNSQVIEFVCWITGKDADLVSDQLDLWLSEQRAKPPKIEKKDPVISRMKHLQQQAAPTGLEVRYRLLSEKLLNEIDSMTVRECAEIMDEQINIEYKLESNGRNLV